MFSLSRYKAGLHSVLWSLTSKPFCRYSGLTCFVSTTSYGPSYGMFSSGLFVYGMFSSGLFVGPVYCQTPNYSCNPWLLSNFPASFSHTAPTHHKVHYVRRVNSVHAKTHQLSQCFHSFHRLLSSLIYSVHIA
jgi:hypothetical protein